MADDNVQGEKVQEQMADDKAQAENVPEHIADDKAQAENVPEHIADDKVQTEKLQEQKVISSEIGKDSKPVEICPQEVLSVTYTKQTTSSRESSLGVQFDESIKNEEIIEADNRERESLSETESLPSEWELWKTVIKNSMWLYLIGAAVGYVLFIAAMVALHIYNESGFPIEFILGPAGLIAWTLVFVLATKKKVDNLKKIMYPDNKREAEVDGNESEHLLSKSKDHEEAGPLVESIDEQPKSIYDSTSQKSLELISSESLPSNSPVEAVVSTGATPPEALKDTLRQRKISVDHN